MRSNIQYIQQSSTISRWLVNDRHNLLSYSHPNIITKCFTDHSKIGHTHPIRGLGLESIPAITGETWGPIRTHTCTLESPFNPTCLSVHCERKLTYPERTHTDTGGEQTTQDLLHWCIGANWGSASFLKILQHAEWRSWGLNHRPCNYLLPEPQPHFTVGHTSSFGCSL